MSNAPTTSAYLAALPPERREAVSAIRAIMRSNLDPALAEVIQYGMISYVVPHSLYPPGYHCDPSLPVVVAALASQKSHIGIYLMSLYQDEAEAARFGAAWKAAGKKLDMGKSCVRVKGLDGVPVEVLAATLRRVTAKAYIDRYERALAEKGIKHPGKARTAGTIEPGVKGTRGAEKAGAKGTKARSAKATKKSAKKKAKKTLKKTPTKTARSIGKKAAKATAGKASSMKSAAKRTGAR